MFWKHLFWDLPGHQIQKDNWICHEAAHCSTTNGSLLRKISEGIKTYLPDEHSNYKLESTKLNRNVLLRNRRIDLKWKKRHKITLTSYAGTGAVSAPFSDYLARDRVWRYISTIIIDIYLQ